MTYLKDIEYQQLKFGLKNKNLRWCTSNPVGAYKLEEYYESLLSYTDIFVKNIF